MCKALKINNSKSTFISNNEVNAKYVKENIDYTINRKHHPP